MKSSRQVLDIRRDQTNRRYLPFGVKAGFIIFAIAHSISGLTQPSAVPPPPNPTSTASAKPPSSQAPAAQAASIAGASAASSAPPGVGTSAASTASGSAASTPSTSSSPAAGGSTPASTPPVATEEQYGKSYGWMVASALALLSLLVSVFAVLLSILTIWRNWSIARVNIVATCHKTYGEIFSELFELREAYRLQGPLQAAQAANQPLPMTLPVIKSRAHSLFIKLWNLQHEQYLYFREGLIPQPIFESWLTYRYADYHGVDYDFDGVNYKWTWDTRKTEFGAQSEFVRFMDLAMDTARVHANDPDAPARARSEAMQLYLQLTETNNLKRHWGRIVDFYSH
ncbi:UNVERIFIED_ORG: hypothetical protein BDU10_2542 [Burkholderia sp. CF145]